MKEAVGQGTRAVFSNSLTNIGNNNQLPHWLNYFTTVKIKIVLILHAEATNEILLGVGCMCKEAEILYLL